MPTEKWSGFTQRANLLTTELNALANGSYSAVGTELDNGSNLDRFGVAELIVDFVSAPTDRAAIDLYGVLAPNGTNYADGGGATRPSAFLYLGTFQCLATTAAQRLLTARFELQPCKMKLVIHNRSGQDFPATGSIVNAYTANKTVN